MSVTLETRPRDTGARDLSLADHVVTSDLELFPGESVVDYATRLVSQAFFPRAGMDDQEMARLDKALDYIPKYCERFPLEIIRMDVEGLKEVQRDIAQMFDVNPRSRELNQSET